MLEFSGSGMALVVILTNLVLLRTKGVFFYHIVLAPSDLVL